MLSDAMDIQFLLRIAYIFKENGSQTDAKMSVDDLFAKEITKHAELISQQLLISRRMPK